MLGLAACAQMTRDNLTHFNFVVRSKQGLELVRQDFAIDVPHFENLLRHHEFLYLG